MKQKFVSFYADRDGSDYYSSCGKKLKERLDELGVRSSIEEMESFNDYMLNCLQKPKFMLKSLKESKEPIIWLDVDVTVNELPTELSDLDDDVDMAFSLREHDLKTPHSAIIYMNYNDKVIQFLENWVEKCDSKVKDSVVGKYTLTDHEQLILSVQENKFGLNIKFFPPDLCSVRGPSKINIGLSKGDFEMNKMRAYYPPFRVDHGSSNSKLKPKKFKWTEDYAKIEVFIDNGMGAVDQHPRQKDVYRFGWLCESKFIVPNVYSALFQHHDEFFKRFDAIFTCDEDLLKLDDRFVYSLSGSNLPWTPESEYGIHEKKKICSLLASPKLTTRGHKLRHAVANQYKDKIDLFGGVGGSEQIGTTGWASSNHPPKTEALKDYMFSITIENESYNNYYTEKITDCFANGTIPVYWGCPNIGEHFNEKGIILLDENFDINSLTQELYESKLEYVKDNFERVSNLDGSDDILWDKITKFIGKPKDEVRIEDAEHSVAK